MAKLYVRKSDGTYVPQQSVLVSNLDIVQEKGDSLISVMSQKAVTDELKGKQDTIIDIETIRSNAQNASDVVTNMTNAGYLFAGIATIDTNPGTPDAKVFYIANGKGTYTNFGGLEVTEDDVVVLYWDTAWHKVPTGIASQAKLSELEQKNREFSNSIQDLNDDNLYITDKDGHVVAKINSNGIESVEVTAKGKKLSEQDTSTDIIQDLYTSELYITDGNGNVVTKIDETGISCIGIDANNLLQNQWNKKNIATYGDSITALNGGNYSSPYSKDATDAKWGGKVAKYFNFANIYNRGIGSTTFNYYNTQGGQVAWCRTNTGEYVDRNDSYNYDNYEGNVTIPSDCTPIRGCGSSWLRITTMFPESIKNTIDVVLVMFHNDFHQDMDTECTWVEGSNYDTEWAASEYYKDYGGDYNIETVRGGIASTYMKLQAWMPQALIVLMSPISGVYINGNDDVMDLENTESAKMKKLAETVKDIAFRLSVPFIDVYGTDCINSLNKKLRNYITDGIHPYSDAGCKVIARAIISGLQSIVPYINY